MWDKMKKGFLLLLAALLPLMAQGQDLEVYGRASVAADVKLVKGLHLQVEEELRCGSGFSSLGSVRTTASLSYKAAKFLKFGAGYTLINPYKASEASFNYPRHRLWADVTGSLRLGDFQLSLKEKLQFTHRTGVFNVYQSTPDAWSLKSRVGVKYKGFDGVEPSLSFEVRTALNEPWGTTSGYTQTSASGKIYYNYTPTGYTNVYNNRYRLNLGADIQLSKHHQLEPYVMLDFCSDYEIDTNGDGTRLFSETTGWNDSKGLVLGLSYTYSF